MGMQGILLHHDAQSPSTTISSHDEKLSTAEISIDEYAKSSPVTIKGESQASTHGLKFKFALPDLFYSNRFNLKFIELSIKRQINLANQVDLYFGIREIKFPSHFFW